MNQRLVIIFLLVLAGIGAPVWALYCNGCGTKAPDDSKFCGQCGRPLPVMATATESASVTVSPMVFTGSVGSPTTLVTPPSPQAFQVTSHYLVVNGYRVSRRSLFWIAEITGGRARIWCMNEPPTYGVIMGWVSLDELEKRSTWKPTGTIYCLEPPPPTAEIVIVRERPYWRHWEPRPFVFYWSSGGHGHHGRGGSHRRH